MYQTTKFKIHKVQTDETERNRQIQTWGLSTLSSQEMTELLDRNLAKDIEELNNIINQQDLINMHRTIYPKQQNTYSLQLSTEHIQK